MKEVSDCKDMSNWAEQCQLILKSTYGMDYNLFFDFLKFIAKRRLSMVLEKQNVITFNRYKLGLNHCVFDLHSIKLTLIDFINDMEEKSIYYLICEKQQAHKLLNKILLFIQTYDSTTHSSTWWKDKRIKNEIRKWNNKILFLFLICKYYAVNNVWTCYE